jgi:hypothetical protein
MRYRGPLLIATGGLALVAIAAAPTYTGLLLSGSSSGVVTIQPGAAAAGTYNYNLPTTAGSSGAPLLSGGGAAAAMTWGSVLGTAAAANTGTSGSTVPLLNGTNTWAATQTVAAIASTPQALTYAATVTPDLSTSNYFTLTLTGNVTLASPSNQHTGQSGCIAVTQDGTGSRTIAFGGNWKFAGGIAPTLTTTASAVDDVCYWVVSAGVVHGTFIPNVQ